MPHQTNGTKPDWNPREAARHNAQVEKEILKETIATQHTFWTQTLAERNRAFAALGEILRIEHAGSAIGKIALEALTPTAPPADPIGNHCPQCHAWTPGEVSTGLCKACQLETLGEPAA